MQMDDTMITSTAKPKSTEIDDKEDDGDKVNKIIYNKYCIFLIFVAM